MSKELWQESATSLAKKIKSGETTSRDVIESHLGRIEEINTSVNAIVEIHPDEVRRNADAADAAQNSGAPLGPLHGVPFTVKVNLDLAGHATTHGSVALKDNVVTGNAPAVERMLQAGGVALGHTNMPDLGLRINTQSALHGDTHNPWRHGVTAAGSSGGEAAAISSGMSPIGLGNDIGGSLRNPAYACGIASIKPSRGRVPGGNPSDPYPMNLNAQIMLVDGVLARTIDDVRTGLEAVMGAHPSDPISLSAPLKGAPVAKRVALVPEPIGGSTHPDIAEGVRIAGRALSAAGYEVEEIEIPMLFDAYFNWAELMMQNSEQNYEMYKGAIGEGGMRFLDLTGVDFPPMTPADLHRMHNSRHTIAKTWRMFMSQYPLIVGPVWTQPPFEHNFDTKDTESAMQVIEMYRFVLPANLLGLPAACVATGVSNGLPTGVQVMGDMFREDVCLDAAEVIESAVGVLTPIDPRN